MTGTLEGIVTRTSKNGKVGSVLFIGGESMTDYDMQADIKCEGFRCESVWVPREVNAHKGDQVELVYGVGFQGKAVVTDVKVFPKNK